MRFQGAFGTLKMVDQGGKVNCCIEYTEGELLMNLIRHAEEISKMQLMEWLREICVQVDAYHRYYHRAYQYINPYTILISKENTIRLLDLEAEENEMVLIYIQKNIIRESFSRTNSMKKTKISRDFYSLGKTLQLILSRGNISPPINRVEEHKLLCIIKKCLEESSEHTYQNIKEIQKQIPKVNGR